MIKNLPADIGDTKDAGLILGLGRSHRADPTHSNILAWKISWTEEPGGLQFIGLDMTEHTRYTTLKEYQLSHHYRRLIYYLKATTKFM